MDATDGITTLPEALQAANADTSGSVSISFDLGDGEHIIPLCDPLSIEQPMTISGAGSGTVTISSVGTASRSTSTRDGITYGGGTIKVSICTADISLLQVASTAPGTTLSDLHFTGPDSGTLASLSADTTFIGDDITGFTRVVQPASAGITLSLAYNRIHDNNAIMAASSSASGPDALSGTELTLTRNRLEGNASLLSVSHALSTPFTATLEHNRITGNGPGALFTLEGPVSLAITDSTINANSALMLLSADPSPDVPATVPQVSITGSTLSGNQWDDANGFVQSATGMDFSLLFSTIAENEATTGGPLLSLNGNGSLISHSIITRNTGITYDVSGDTDINYSLVDSTDTSPVVSNEVVGDASLGSLRFDGDYTGYYLPDPASPVIDASNPSWVAGTGRVPDEDMRGSERVINALPDLGAVEYNNPPTLDLDALNTAIRKAGGKDLLVTRTDPGNASFLIVDLGGLNLTGTGSSGGFGSLGSITITGLGDLTTTISGRTATTKTSGQESRSATSKTTSTDIYVDLDDYVHDPDDGDTVDYIALDVNAPDGVSLDSSTHQLSGTREAFLSGPIALAFRDNHGLVGKEAFKVTHKPDSSSGGGSLPLWVLASLALLGLRRRRAASSI